MRVSGHQSNRGPRGRGLRIRAVSLALSLVSGIGLVSCKSRGFIASTEGAFSGTSHVLVHCMTPQGNGGNWAATLSWVAAEFEGLAVRAEQVTQSKGAPTLVYPRCFSGGSSGSGVTATVMSLLSNEKVFSGPEATRGARAAGYFSPQDMRELSHALRFLAISTDMTTSETLHFFKQLVAEQTGISLRNRDVFRVLNEDLRGRLERSIIRLNPIQDNSDGERVDRASHAFWWSTSLGSAEEAVSDFGKTVHAARMIDWQTLNRPVSEIFNGANVPLSVDATQENLVKVLEVFTKVFADKSLMEDLQAFAQDRGMNRVSDSIRLKAIEEFNCQITDQCRGVLGAAMKVAQSSFGLGGDENALIFASYYLVDALQAFYAGVMVDKLARTTADGTMKPVKPPPLSGQLYDFITQFNAELARARDGVPASQLRSSLTQTLWDPLQTGFFTMTSSAIQDEGPSPVRSKLTYYRTPPPFEKMRFVAFASEDMIRAIRSSALYAEDTQACERGISAHPVCRFVLAEVKNVAFALLPSLREPGLIRELYAPAFDPKAAGSEHIGVHSLFDPLTQKASEAPVDMTGPLGLRTYFAVGGGWPDRRLKGWLLQYYLDALVAPQGEFSVFSKFEKLTGTRPKVLASVSLFGKPDRVSQAENQQAGVSDFILARKFDVRTVSEVFSQLSSSSGSAGGGLSISSKNRQEYLSMMSAYYSFVKGPRSVRGAERVPVLFSEILNNWDIGDLPFPAVVGFGPDGGATRFLVALSHNSFWEGFRSLGALRGQASGQDLEQTCSLSRVNRLQSGGLAFGPVRFTKGQWTGDVYLDRLQCVRFFASPEAKSALGQEGWPSPEQVVANLSSQATYSFNVLDARFNGAKGDAPLILRNPDGSAMTISGDQVPPLSPQQTERLQANDGSGG